MCTTLSAACVGFVFGTSGGRAGLCVVFGSALPDQGTGAAAPGKALDRWLFYGGNGGSDTLTRVKAITGDACHAKQPGASGMHPPMPSPHPQ